ncbi:tetratricopeptide repeat protein [Microvirga flavescens]|uniref:tetratricopeptide repeat protein n=1 Tax=Microvirga flavescens TaxID=2249811 RepID=UPI000DDC0A33|nr:tetratricopeptide repeat protein [Microvirga flavescens]
MRLFAFLLAGFIGLTAIPVQAQESTPPKSPQETPRPQQARRPITLDSLFDRLAKAQDEDEAKGIAAQIEKRWERSGSDTADLLLSRANEAVEAKDYPLAVELLDRVITLQPNWAEAWNQRATVFYLLDDPVSAMADLRQTLKLEPRQFNAWAGLGHIYMASDDKARALNAYRRALAINPQFPILKKIVDHLAPEIDGLDL